VVGGGTAVRDGIFAEVRRGSSTGQSAGRPSTKVQFVSRKAHEKSLSYTKWEYKYTWCSFPNVGEGRLDEAILVIFAGSCGEATMPEISEQLAAAGRPITLDALYTSPRIPDGLGVEFSNQHVGHAALPSGPVPKDKTTLDSAGPSARRLESSLFRPLKGKFHV
jgi:hypothetical protein